MRAATQMHSYDVAGERCPVNSQEEVLQRQPGVTLRTWDADTAGSRVT